ncbi:MAG: hypothetical protein U1E65_05260 [Myxococcota bacterium]
MAEEDKTRATVQTFGDEAPAEEAYDARRVPAYRPDPSDPSDRPQSKVDGTRVMESAPPDTGRPREVTRSAPSSSELAQKSQKQRRRDRDQRAEKAAQRAVIGLALALGVGALVVINSGILDDEPSAHPQVSEVPVSAPPKPALTAAPDETPDLPLFTKLRSEGLTIVAEGLPEVVAVDPPNPPPLLAGIETCRFAYAVWEFSPNKVFRFLSTCAVLDGQVLVGAYELQGSTIRLSPLNADGATTISVFEVEKPSRMVSTVSIRPRADGPTAILEVRQRITVMRPGMEGNTFFRAYAPKNTTEIQGMPTRRAKDGPGGGAGPGAPGGGRKEEPAKKDNDPVLDLLKGGGE